LHGRALVSLIGLGIERRYTDPATKSRSATAELLRRLAEVVGTGVVLWRGEQLSGADVDLLVLAWGDRLADSLAEAGMSPRPGDSGHVVWDGADGLPVDVLSARAWPTFYPSLPGLASRLERGDHGLLVAAPEDRLLMAAAEAVAGRPLERLARRVAPLLEVPGRRERLRQVAAQEGMLPLVALVDDPGRLSALARRGRLPYSRAAVVALRSGHARRALGTRLVRRLERLAAGRQAPWPRPRRRRGPLVITVSGMDGSGKSSAAELLRERLTASGVPAEVSWGRLGSESEVLDPLAAPVKRLLRRRGTVADPVAAGGPGVSKTQDPREASGRRRPVSSVWILLVAVANLRTYRRATAGRRATIVCDRWITDALVDLELRYGRHRGAAWILRRLGPRRDLGILLEIDATTAAARKPGDQAEQVLTRMQQLYARRAFEERLVTIDAGAPRDEVERRLNLVVDALVATHRE
jgi:thymidylate kinase